MTAPIKTIREMEKEREDARVEARRNAPLLTKIGAFLFFGFIVSAIIYGFWSYFVPESTPSDCRMTTKEVQTIKKLDGDVSSVVTEMVDGCEYPDGTFIPAPDSR